MTYLMCLVTFYMAHEGIVELNLKGIFLNETATHYVGDFSKDIKRFPIIGSADRYSKVPVEKSKCWKFEENI